MISLTYASPQRPRKTSNNILTNFHTILKTQISIKSCEINFSFISAISHPPTQWSAHAKSKKLKNRVLAPFWDPILAKLKNLSKITFIINVSTSFVRKKPIYAYANDFHIISLFYRILEQSLFRDYDVISQNPVENRKNIIQKILCTSFVHIENAILELLHMFYF